MINSALNVAKYIINYCNTKEHPISNLKLQKILYYIQGYSLALRNQPAFNEDIQVWPYGPVVKPVYDTFSIYAAKSINNVDDVELNDNELQAIIQIVADEKMYIPVWDLVEQTHEEAPWKYTKQVYGIGSIIPKDFIRDYFCQQVK